MELHPTLRLAGAAVLLLLALAVLGGRGVPAGGTAIREGRGWRLIARRGRASWPRPIPRRQPSMAMPLEDRIPLHPDVIRETCDPCEARARHGDLRWFQPLPGRP